MPAPASSKSSRAPGHGDGHGHGHRHGVGQGHGQSHGDGHGDGHDHSHGHEHGHSHGAACSCFRCSIATSLDSVTDERRRLLHERFPKAKFQEHPDCDVDPLVWSDLDLQLNHFDCCLQDEERKGLLRLIYKKVNYVREDGEPGYWNNQRVWNNYDARASILALSDYQKRESFCKCGYARKDSQSSACGDICFCPRCCYNIRTLPVLEEYGDCFGADREVYFITLGSSRDEREESRLIFKDLTSSEMEQIKVGVLAGPADSRGLRFVDPEDYIQCQAYWDMQKQVIKRAIEKSWLSGAVGAPELAVRFAPLGVNPHRHYVAFSPGLTADQGREMRRWMKALIRQSRRISDKLQPSLAIYRITTQDDYEAVLKYCFKPIAIEQAYDLAAAGSDRAADFLRRLNYETNLFLDGVDLVFLGVTRLDRRGICSTSSGAHYCGHVTPERMKKRVRERIRRRKKKAEKARAKAEALKWQARKGKRKRKRSDEDFVDHVQYTQLVRSGDIPPPPKRSFRRQTRRVSVPAPRVLHMTDQKPAQMAPPKKPVSIMSPKLRSAIQRLFPAAHPQKTIPALVPSEVEISAGRTSSVPGGENSLQERIQPLGEDK